MRGGFRAVGLVGLVAVAGLLTAGTASAAPASATRGPVCGPNMISRDVPENWVPRSPSDGDRRFKWDQVRRWDRDHDNRLSDREIADFRKAGESIPGGPDCGRPEHPRR